MIWPGLALVLAGTLLPGTTIGQPGTDAPGCLHPVDLRCELAVNPMGIDVEHPGVAGRT